MLASAPSPGHPLWLGPVARRKLELLKDVIRTQRPDIITLAPPCGPWSAWQIWMRKRKQVLRELRLHHLPFWQFVCWRWEFQDSTGGLVVLEQPSSSEALRLPIMSRCQRVHQKVVHLCQLGLDRISGKPRKKPTAVQMNHPALETETFPTIKICDCPPGGHQPIEGTVRVRDPVEGGVKSARRSTFWQLKGQSPSADGY